MTFGKSDVSNITILVLTLKNVSIKYLPPVWPKLVPKLKVLRSYWNLAHFMFRVSWSQCWCQKLFLLNTYHLFGPKMKRAQNLTKFGTFNISNMPILILMSKMTFMKYLPHVRPKFVPILKVPRIHWNFNNVDLDFNVENDFFIKYLPIAQPSWSKIKNVQNLLKFAWIYISNMLIMILMSKWFLLNIYHMLTPNLSQY